MARLKFQNPQLYHGCKAKFCLLALLLISVTASAMADTVVHKLVDPMDSPTWQASQDSTAVGSVTLAQELPADLKAIHALEISASFSGKGFEYFQSIPSQPIVIPGETKAVSLWVRNRSKYAWVLQFKDGWGRNVVDGQKLEWTVARGGESPWSKVTFTVPAGWVQPLQISGIFAHNWDFQQEKAAARIDVGHLETDTDIGRVDASTGLLSSWHAPSAALPGQASLPHQPAIPLLSSDMVGTELHNVFSGVKPSFLITIRNWLAAPAIASLKWKVAAEDNVITASGEQNLKVEDHLALNLPLTTPGFGVYKFTGVITWADGKKTTSSQPFAVIPVARELTDAQKDVSPYGLNVLSARQPMVSTFRKAGVVWFRDYGFNFDWMVRARGEDNRYAGWPWYPKIVRDYEANGARVLANLQTSMHPPSGVSSVGPDRGWTRDLVGMLLAFPSIRAFELDNEYDLRASNARAEEPIAWKNYGLYHKKFGEVARLLGDGQFTAVENGRAGIWPERLRKMVLSGDFAAIDVVNSHHYTGPDAPETNVMNFNMGFTGDEKPQTLYDQLRAAKAAGSSDGKPRQHWLTEFGWDTKAGPVVTPLQQAAYLPRAYMLLLAAGTSKGFWYWDLDSEKANQFFDGCGLFTFAQTPKLAFATYAGLTRMLPTPEYVGTIHAGENTWGYLFRNSNDGKLVASLWTLDGKPGPKVDFGPAALFDAYANALPAGGVTLNMMPVYAVGISEESRWFKQAAYRLETPYYVSASSGDTLTASLVVSNARKSPIHSTVQLKLPSGWTDVSGAVSVAVEPGKSTTVPLTFRVAPEEVRPENTLQILISEGDPLDSIPVRVAIQQPIELKADALHGDPGAADLIVKVRNRSSKLMEGVLHFTLPSTWSAKSAELKVDGLKPGELREMHAGITWTDHWKQGETAGIEFRSVDGRIARQPIIPGRLTIAHIARPALDGDVKKWPTAARLPAWTLGAVNGAPDAVIYLGWSSEGIWIGVEVHNSKAIVPDPRSFWVGDVLELFVDTHNSKSPRKYAIGDHQFWFAPLTAAGRAYAGQWKRGDEIAATRYDIEGIGSKVVHTPDGYIMECLVPASQLSGFKGVPDTRLGLNLNLSVKGSAQDREVFWSLPKDVGVDQPGGWATVILGN